MSDESLQHQRMQFRSDINALRAVAILSVVLFHFFPDLVPGGFVGVDIFFVVSGYLMTALLARRPTKGILDYLHFMQRRASRIIPELLFMIVILLFIALAVFPNFELYSYTRESLAAVLHSSNIVYFRELDYFAEISHAKWLLHTWSLSLEMQVYLIFPMLVLCISILGNKFRSIWYGVLGFFIISVGSIYLGESNQKAAFYLPTLRVWEFLGGILAYRLTGHPIASNKNSPILVLLLLAVILACVWFAEGGGTWPNFLTLVTVCSTMGILTFNFSSVKFLHLPWIQRIGDVSYSWYLWHWPVAVFLYKADWLQSVSFAFLGLLISYVFASVSFIIFRKWNRQLRGLDLKLLLVISGFVFSLIFLIRLNSDGNTLSQPVELANTLTTSPLRKQCHAGDGYGPSVESACVISKGQVASKNVGASIAVFGDSHGVELAYALSNRVPVLQLTHSACPPMHVSESTGAAGCNQWKSEALSYLVGADGINTVLLAWRYGLYVDRESDGKLVNKDEIALRRALDDLARELSDRGKTVIFLEPVPDLKVDIRRVIFREHIGVSNNEDLFNRTLLDYFRDQEPFISLMGELKEAYPNVEVVKTREAFCGVKHCVSVADNKALYFDDNHPSIYGAHNIISLFIDSTISSETKGSKF